MGTAKVVTINARPLQASHLCFEVDGILGQLNTQLGATATLFDFDGFYATLASAPTTGDPSRLEYDAPTIQSSVQPATLASLRAEPRKAALNKAINSRQNTYYAKYANASDIIGQIISAYSPSLAGSKAARLANLAVLAQQQANTMGAAYTADGRAGVVKTTTSQLSTTGSSNQESGEAPVGEQTLAPLPPPGVSIGGKWGFTGNMPENLTVSVGDSTESQTVTNWDYGYRVPYLESQAQNERAQISLIDQQFPLLVGQYALPNLVNIFNNDLSSMDSDVYRLQVAFLNTILLAPFAGTVTGVYKNPGDAVKAGEPVIRVEDNTTVLLVATLIYRDPIVLGSTVKVKTSLYDSASSPLTISGSVVSVRGNKAGDDHWDVVVSCNNVGSGGAAILPINYSFDFDDTVVTIT